MGIISNGKQLYNTFVCSYSPAQSAHIIPYFSVSGAEGTGTLRPQKKTVTQMNIIFVFGKFCQFLPIFKDLWNSFGNLAVVQ